MIYLSKGIVQKGSTEQLLFVLYGGQKFELTGNAAAAWLNGRFKFAEALGRNEAPAAYLQKLGLVETEADNDGLSRYRIASRCIFCPADTTGSSVLRAMDKEILQWLKNAGVRLTVAELVYLIENGINPTQDLLYTDNRQRLIERIYTVGTIADNLLENQMETAKCRDAVVQSLMRLLKKKLVRFISVSDDYDSSSANAGEKLAATLKNLINDMYAKDISKKICSTIKNKRLRGDYIGNYAPYGYLKDENNRSRLVIDHEIAPIVVEIFELRAKGTGFDTICRILNEKGYPSPGRLRYERGIITNNNMKGSELPWNRHVLKDLLVNVVYIGNLAQGRSSQCLYKGEKYHWTKEVDWDVVEGTHEPIISMELWNKVQEINKKVSSDVKKSFGRYAHLPKRPNPYGSVLRCADCGRVMKYVRSYTRPRKDGVVTDYYNYKCPTNIELGDTTCSKKSIRADDLDEIVLSVIRKQMDLFLDTQKTLLGLIALEKEKAKHSVPANRVKELQDKLDQKKKLFSRLYIDFKDGILTQREYLLARDVYQKEIAAYETELQELQAIKTKTKVTETGTRKWNRLISRYYKAETVTEEMVEAMVDEIRVNTDGSLDIRFKYMPEFEEMFKECERIRKEVA